MSSRAVGIVFVILGFVAIALGLLRMWQMRAEKGQQFILGVCIVAVALVAIYRGYVVAIRKEETPPQK